MHENFTFLENLTVSLICLDEIFVCRVIVEAHFRFLPRITPSTNLFQLKSSCQKMWEISIALTLILSFRFLNSLSPKFQLHNSTTLFRTDVKDRRGRRITLNPSSWTGKWFYSSDLLALSFVLRSSVLAIRSTQDLTRSLQQESHTRNNDRMQFVKRDSFRRVHTEGQ